MEVKTPLFQRPLWVSLFALTAAVVWGWAYPLIKLGFAEFAITPDMTGSKMVFAGIRFLLSGLIVLSMAGAKASARHTDRHEAMAEVLPVTSGAWWFILLYALLNTTLHYTFFYIGLSHAEGSRSAILNSLSVFLVVILACVFFKSDRLTSRKLLGCVVGFAGIMALNLGTDALGARFTLLGDGMIILNALCGASASLLTRGLQRRIPVFAGTGYSLAIGGALLVIPGLLLGGNLPRVTLLGMIYLLLLIGISTIGFSLYNKLITCNPVGRVAIYNSLIPVVGTITSCLCLGEQFYAHYALAGALAATGIYLINSQKS